MKKYKRFGAAVLSFVLAAVLLSATAFAAVNVDLGRDVSLTISYEDDGTPLVGARFNIYLAASMDENGKLSVTEQFQNYNVNIDAENGKAQKTLASTLEGYVLRDKIEPTDSGKTDDSGKVHFPTDAKSLPKGLYLVLGERHIQGQRRYDAMPFMVMLPGDDGGEGLEYDVESNAKSDSDDVPETPGKTDIKVIKIWKGENCEHIPEKIVVQLLRDGEIYDTVVLNAENNWSYTWIDLDDSYKWTAVENAPEGFTVEVTREGITFIIVNTCDEDAPYNPDEPDVPDEPDAPDKPDSPDKPNTPNKPTDQENEKLPQTGQLWWPVPVMLAIGLLLIVIGVVRRKGTE